MERIRDYDNSLRGRRPPLDEDEWEGCEAIIGGEVGGYSSALSSFFARLPFVGAPYGR
jgi:hypothetical protein